MANEAAKNGLAGLRILCLESRRGQEMAKLISNYGGEAIVAPSMQEITLKDNPEALAFARKLTEGGFDMVIFLTGVGTRALVRLVEAHDLRQKFPHLRKLPSLWTRSFFLSTAGNVSQEIIQNYIERQSKT